MSNGSYRDGKIEAFKMMDRYLYVIAESCDLVTSRDFNTIDAMRGFVKNNLKKLGSEEMTELKPCPCCGSTKIHIVAPDDGCYCWDCGLTMPKRPNWMERWNRRVSE